LTRVRWRAIAMTPAGFVEGQRSLRDPNAPMRFVAYPSDTRALADVRGVPAVRRLAWFNHGFEQVQVHGGTLTIVDLRMGRAPDFPFRFDVATRGADGWQAINPPHMPSLFDVDYRPLARALWQRLLRALDHAATGSSGTTPATSASK
jgi:inner membrane protein